MRGEQLLSRLMIAVAFLVAALVFVPAGAYAHGSHNHAVQPVEQVARPVVTPPSDTQLIRVAPLTVEEGLSVTSSRGTPGSLLPTSAPETPQTCPGGCCHSSGTGCCAAFIAAPIEVGIPLPGRSALDIAVIGGAGITPDALPEPPKSLV